jgi:CBS domain-containing protein
MDARERWYDLESDLERAERLLERGEEQAQSYVRELTESVYSLLHDVQTTVELATPVEELMTKSPRVCAPGASLAEAARIMWETDCGSVPVVAEDGRLLGIVTDRDICMATYTRGQGPLALSVSSTMSRELCCAAPEDTLGHAVYLMGTRQVHRLPITEAGRLVGILSLADVARYLKSYPGNSVPGCVALAHTIAGLSAARTPSTANAA